MEIQEVSEFKTPKRDREVTNAVLAAYFVNSIISGDLAWQVEETCGVERSSSGGLAEEPFQHVVKVGTVHRWRTSQRGEKRWTGSWVMR